MCSKPKTPKPDTRLQEESLKLQREQMEMARQQTMYQNAMVLESQRITNAAPPPAPNPSAQVAALPLDTSMRSLAIGTGRRKLRTDRSYSSLAIPAT